MALPVLVHGLPETAAIWRPLQERLGRESVALALPGFGTPLPPGFSPTKDAYAAWLADELSRLPGPVDLVGHDIGALISMRVATASTAAQLCSRRRACLSSQMRVAAIGPGPPGALR